MKSLVTIREIMENGERATIPEAGKYRSSLKQTAIQRQVLRQISFALLVTGLRSLVLTSARLRVAFLL